MRILAIDASLTGMALALGIDGEVVGLEEHGSKLARGVSGRLARYRAMTDHALAAINAQGLDLGHEWHVFIEGYSFNSRTSNTTLGEFGGILRLCLANHSAVHTLTEVPPKVLKRWCAGKGNASKLAVATALTKRYGVAFETDNQADAFGLLQLAMCAVGDTIAPTIDHAKVASAVREGWSSDSVNDAGLMRARLAASEAAR